MIYAELVKDGQITERGVFYSLSEFLPFRSDGWTGTPEINEAADHRLDELKSTSDATIKYLAPMIRTGEDYRFEQVRRLKEAK